MLTYGDVDAAKKHHENLARLEKESPEAKAAPLKASRVKRRIRLYERRCMQAKGKEVEIMQQVSEKAMTDEETDCEDNEPNILIRRPPPWRSNKLMKLMRTLDSRKNAKSESVPKECRTGRLSERNPPKDLPKWALQDASTSTAHQYSSSLSGASSPDTLPSQTLSPIPSPVSSPSQSQVPSTLPNQSSPPAPAQTYSSTNTIMQSSTPRASIRACRSSCISPVNSPLSHHVRILPGNTAYFDNDSSSLESNPKREGKRKRKEEGEGRTGRRSGGRRKYWKLFVRCRD